ncbi:ubiquitin carboxyl-terminal hydrolase 19 [Citrus sinensis]|uniref:Ubiquitin carboxyl-terminal hydrolase 19 n=1 Tax=Citrus sinensis TaxID=2711 RepID=A0ACB8NKH5_CITSI|nr:ubiquitin carboxyl-terminal hydrolase 19 [Citrus sinensis]
MHVGGITVDLNWFLQLILTVFIIAFGLLHLVKNTASKYFEVDANFEGGTTTDRSNGHAMSSSVPSGSSDDLSCIVCGNPGSKKCSRCKSVRYCSSKCQTSHWQSGHKRKCKDIGKINSVQGPRSDFGSKISSTGGKNFSGIALVPTHGTSKILFPYDEFLKLFNWDKPGFAPCGLLNCGNSCFANVVLQCLTYTRPLVAYLLEKGHRKECGRDDWCFLCEFQTHVEKASQSSHPFSPMSILSRLPNIGGNLGYGRQEDAHEFMRFAIDTMQSICLDEFGGEKAVPPRSQETTLIQHIFSGHLQSQVICSKCNNISNQYENMMDLTVEIHGDAASLEECLDQFTAKEWLDGDNMYKCDGCNDYVKAWKRLTVRRAPNILTIALKRFQSGRFGKLNKRVTFPETLDLSPYMSDGGDRTDVYKLYAVVVHVDMLNASFFGHYICYVKDFRGHWYRVDDCKVTSVDLEEVLSQGAYMLLYNRVSARPSYLVDTESSSSRKEEPSAVNAETEPKEVECSSTMESINPNSRSLSLPCDDFSHLRVSSCKSKSAGAIDPQAVPAHFKDTNVDNIESSSNGVFSHESHSSSFGLNSEDLRVDAMDVDTANAQSSSWDRQDFSNCNGKLSEAKRGIQDDMNIDDPETSLSVPKAVPCLDSDSEAVLKDTEGMNIVKSEPSSLAAKDIKVCGSICPCPSETSSATLYNWKHETPFNGLDDDENGFKRVGIEEEISQ